MTCNGKKVQIDGKDYVLVNPEAVQSSENVVLVRTRGAGVHVGELLKPRNGMELTLHNAHRVWRWRGANTLSE